MISEKEFENMKRDIKELQAKTHACYCMIQHLNRVIMDMGMDIESQNKNFFPEGKPMQNSRYLDEIKRIATNFRKAIIKVKDIKPNRKMAPSSFVI